MASNRKASVHLIWQSIKDADGVLRPPTYGRLSIDPTSKQRCGLDCVKGLLTSIKFCVIYFDHPDISSIKFFHYWLPALFISQVRTLTEKIIFEGTKAVGVQCIEKGTVSQIRASKEVILSGGAINSPQLLMLSGIGQFTKLTL